MENGAPECFKSAALGAEGEAAGEVWYPGLAQLVARVVWDHQAGSSSLPSRTNLH